MSARPLLYALAAIALLLATSTASEASGAKSAASIYTASPTSIQPLNSTVLPVLVRVSKEGKITYLAPAYELRSRYLQLLRKSLEEMITQPARNKGGAPIASEFIMYLTGKTSKRDDGRYDFQFSYLSAKPVPFGNWVWGQFSSGQLALLSPDINGFNVYDSLARRGLNVQNGACYYGGYYYSHCVIFTCAHYGTCNLGCSTKGKSDTHNSQEACQKKDQGKATGNQIRAASEHVYRLHRPVTAAYAGDMRVQRVRTSRFHGSRAAEARRFPPTLPSTTPSSVTPDARMAPPVRAFGNGGRSRSTPPEPIVHGAVH